MADRRIGRFRDESARRRYMRAYRDALATWPGQPTEIDIETRYGSTHVLATGPVSGSPIVLLHGITFASPSWAPNVGALAVTHPVYAIDTIGDVGRSAQTAAVRTRDDMALWLDEVLTGLDIEAVHLVGMSYGGWVSLNQVRRAPGRLASVTAIDPVGSIGRMQGTFLVRIVPDSIGAAVFKSDPALHRLLRALNNGSLPEEPLLELAVAGLRTFRGKQPVPRRMSDDDLRGITTPTQVIFCGRSPVNHAHRAAQRCRERMPNVTVDVIADAGHMLPLEQPALFADRVLDFVNRVDG